MAEYGQLVVSLQGNTLRSVTLDANGLRIGRTPDNDLVLASPLIASRHAQFEVRPEGVFVTDLGGPQGTLLNGKKIAANQPTKIEGGATLQIGLFVLTFVAAASQPAPEVPSKRKTAAPEPVPLEPPAPAVPLAPPPPPAPPRETHPVPTANGLAGRYLEYLPSSIHSDFLSRYLQIMESVLEPLEWREDHRSLLFAAKTAPAGFLEWLGRWLDADVPRFWPEERKRRFLGEAFELYRWRGTTSGLQRMLEVCVGCDAQIREAGAFVFAVSLSESDRNQQVLIEELIRAHKPAHAAYKLEWIAQKTGEGA
jgi:phage tail-like protein